MGSLCKSGSLVKMNDSSELKHIYRGTAFATNVYRIHITEVIDKFQSLYRGTAFATNVYRIHITEVIDKFQSLYRGTAFATSAELDKGLVLRGVSIPLSRDSLCNVHFNGKDRLVRTAFQSLYRGTAFAT